MKLKCYECSEGTLVRKPIEYMLHGVALGRFPAEVCSGCGEQFFNEETSVRIEEAARKAGVWGLCVQTKVGRSGNALDVRIAQPLAHFVGLAQGSEVTIHPEGKKKLVIEVT